MNVVRRSKFSDEYCHPSFSVMYTPCNVPGVGANLGEFEAQFAAGCDCRDGKCSSASSCPCIAQFGSNFSDDGLLLDSKFDGPIVECNSECGCFERGKCRNRLVQYGPLGGMEIFSTENGRGLALRNSREVLRGTFLCEYAGEIVGIEEARRRVQFRAPGEMNYVFVLNEHLSNGSVLKTCVDPTVVGNIGRYINHSCQPNSAVVPVRTDGPVPKLGVFALRTLGAGEEITFDYGGGAKIEQGKRVDSVFRTPCLCGAPNCGGFLPFDAALL